MNIIDEDNNSKTKVPHTPFWEPWGTGGCLWRTLLFLLGMCIICLLLASLLRGCKSPSIDNLFNPFSNDSTMAPPYKDLPPALRDTAFVDGWNDIIPGVTELPTPDDNYIPPIDSTRIITNPEDSLSQIICDQLVVFFNSKDVKQDMASFTRQFKQNYPNNAYKVIYYNPTAGTMLLGVPQNELLKVVDELPQKITGIDFLVTTNEVLNGAAKPSDPDFNVQKYSDYFKLIQAYDAWDITKGSKDVKVAIIDSYFDLSNPEIGERYSDCINITTKRVNVLPPAKSPTIEDIGNYCHGSHVAGLAIGTQNNQLGCSGIAPECSWIPVALGSDPWSMLQIMEGVLYAIYHDADVINMSIGGISEEAAQLPLGDQIRVSKLVGKRAEAVWDYIVKTANDHNCIICKAAGNETALMGMDFMNRSKQVINVEAVDNKGQKADFSNFGIVKEADIHYSTVAAPGVQLWSVTDKRCAPLWNKSGVKVSIKDGFQEMNGTSMAAPIVTGAVALLKSKNKNLTTEQIIKILTMTGKQTDTKHRIGPTIQIKDALEATGGDLANFDDLMKDHNLLIGKWKSTYELMISDAQDVKIDDMWTYFIFTSTTSGRIEHHTIEKKRIYTAQLNVKWEKDKIIITQLEKAVDSSGNALIKDNFICTSDKDRLLKAICHRNNKKIFDFQLEKVN